MKPNVGSVDRIIRIVFGIALLSMLLWAPGDIKWFGLIGIAPILTAVVRWCPAYFPFGINTGAK